MAFAHTVAALRGTLSLENRVVQGRVTGLDATGRLPHGCSAEIFGSKWP